MPPQLSTIAPTMGPTSGGVAIKLGGQNFAKGARVRFGGTEASDVTVVGESEITLTLPAKLGAWGKVAVEVVHPSGKSVTRADLFSYYASRVDFGSASSVDIGTGPVSLAIADLNGDKNDDLITANLGDSAIGVALGKGSGLFDMAKSTAVGTDPIAVRVVDLNGDKKLDVVTANSYSGDVSVLLGKGDGTFEAAKHTTLGASPTALALADVTGDMKDDVLATTADGKVVILPGKGDGTFDGAATKTVTGFANVEEDFADHAVWNMGALPRDKHLMPWRIEDELKKLKAILTDEQFKKYEETMRNSGGMGGGQGGPGGQGGRRRRGGGG